MGSRKVRHILSLSGGKDSTALALYLRDHRPDLELEYVFCDTGKELDETYEYLMQLEAILGKAIARLKSPGRGFEHWLTIYGNYIPSPLSRWCTRHLKLQPFERYIGNDPVVSYIGLRADEDRVGYISHKPNITTVYPFKEDGIVKHDVMQILDSSGLGLPEYYRWRSRSGCFFCFYQQKIEWVGLLENHRKRFEEAKTFEKECTASGQRYTWAQGESLEELARPERIAQIKAEHQNRIALERKRLQENRLLLDVFSEDEFSSLVLEQYANDDGCLICTL